MSEDEHTRRVNSRARFVQSQDRFGHPHFATTRGTVLTQVALKITNITLCTTK